MRKLTSFTLKPQQLIYIQLFFVCIILFPITEFNIPSSVMNITDVITCVGTVFLVLKLSHSLRNKHVNGIDLAIALFFLYALLTSVVNEVSLLQVAWALRMTLRFYLFYYCCVVLLDRSGASAVLRMFEIMFFVNTLLVAFEFLVQGKEGDYLGGMFGVEQGANGYMNIYLIILLAYEISKYLRQQLSLTYLAFYVIISLGIAALAEIKFLYAEFIVIIICSVLFRYPTRKTSSLFLSAFGLFLAGLQILKLIFPDSYRMMLSAEGSEDYLSASWAGGREMGRTTAIKFIDDSFFSSYPIQKQYGIGSDNLFLNRLFGFGFGSAEPSALTHNAFAEQYSNTQYGAFEFADRYLEMGWIGLSLFVLIFIMIFINTFTSNHANDIEAIIWSEATRVLIPVVLMNVWYSSLPHRSVLFAVFFSRLAENRKSEIAISKNGGNID